ncbi:MAG: hypothetical protein GC157_04640 [Frankiales bacterium]|nr:hypothetical protein [Frankiales bacterium]
MTDDLIVTTGPFVRLRVAPLNVPTVGRQGGMSLALTPVQAHAIAKANPKVPVLWHHGDGDRLPLGRVAKWEVQRDGLYALARLTPEALDVPEVVAMAEGGRPCGVSPGFVYERTYTDPVSGVTNMVALDVIEVSLTEPGRAAWRQSRVVAIGADSLLAYAGTDHARQSRLALQVIDGESTCREDGKPCPTCSSATRTVSHHAQRAG